MEPKFADGTLFEGEGGGYYCWSSDKSPLLSEAKIGAGILVLHPFAFALPHYADSQKIGYVLQGVCRVGLVKPNSSEEVVVIKKGDAIPVPLGGISWWYNAGDSECKIVFLGDTSTAHTPGEITYFAVAGALSIMGAFSTEFVAKSLNLTDKEAETLTKSQTGVLIIKLDGGETTLPLPTHSEDKLYAKIDGETNNLTETNFGGLKKLGLSARYVKLGKSEMFGPVYTTDSSVQMVYVVKGSGRVQITGARGKREIEGELKEGELFIVPKLYPFAVLAEENGIECFCVTTSSKPEFGHLNGEEPIWKAFSLETLQVSLGISAEFAKLFKSRV